MILPMEKKNHAKDENIRPIERKYSATVLFVEIKVKEKSYMANRKTFGVPTEFRYFYTIKCFPTDFAD